MLVALALLLVAGCSKDEPEKKKAPPIPLPAAEVKRAQDACKTYVDKVCACSSPAAQKQCALAKPLPQALELAIDVAIDPKAVPDNSARAQVNVRETAKECIEQTAKLPALGCP